MTLKRDETGRLHIQTPLMAESLMDKNPARPRRLRLHWLPIMALRHTNSMR